MGRRALLVSGIVASLLYVAADVLGAVRWEGYRSTTQAISELSAIDAPSRPLVAPLLIGYDVLLIAFGAGVWATARKSGLRVTAGLLVGIGLIGLVWTPFFPMHLRGVAKTLTDTVHIVLAAVTVLCIVPAIGFAAAAAGGRFRVFSMVIIAVLVGSGALAASDGPRVAAQLPTPWLGVSERICVGSFLLWVIALASSLLHAEQRT